MHAYVIAQKQALLLSLHSKECLQGVPTRLQGCCEHLDDAFDLSCDWSNFDSLGVDHRQQDSFAVMTLTHDNFLTFYKMDYRNCY